MSAKIKVIMVIMTGPAFLFEFQNKNSFFFRSPRYESKKRDSGGKSLETFWPFYSSD